MWKPALVAAIALVSQPRPQTETVFVDEQFDFEHTTGVVYASQPVGSPSTEMDLLLELYEPVGADVPASLPAIILIHGGGFVGGSRFNPRLIQICQRMARRGYVCMSIDYRLAGDDPIIDPAFNPIVNIANAAEFGFPVAVAAAAQDGWAAYEWLAANADELNVDLNRVGIGGGSAGAYTTLNIAYVLDEIGVAPPNTFRGVFDMWGGLGPAVGALDKGDAPLLITHGEDDPTVPVSEALALEARAIEVSLLHEIHVVPGAGHGYDIFSVLVTPRETMFDRFVNFFYMHVGSAGKAFVRD